MKPAVQMVVTILLVAGGIFVYDAMMVRSPAPPADLIEREDAQADEPSEPRIDAEAVPSFAVLEGTGDDLWRADVDRRLAELEQGRATAVRGAGPGASDLPAGAGTGSVNGPGEEAGDAETLDPEEQKRIRRERVAWFRGMLETVERQRRWEQAAKKVKQYLDKLDLALTDEQASNAVRTTVHYQGRWRQLKQAQNEAQAGEQERRDGYQGLWNEYENALRDVLPSAEVDVIVQSMRQAARPKDARR